MSANQTKYPQLRFKGFTDPWEKRTLGQTTTKAKSYSLSRDVERDHETGYRYIHYGDIHTGVADIVTEHTKLPNIEPANYDELRVNDLVVADASEDYQGIAEPAVVVGLPTQHLVAGLHTITLRPSSASSLYLYYLLHTDSFKHFGYQMGTGLKVFGISWSNLSKFTFMIPSRPEQEMIVKLIESVDNLIAVNQRKLAKLKELKQVYLQKMFPKNGSKFPQLRFSGFADAWEERKLSSISERVTRKNKNNESTLPLTISAQDGLVDQNDFFNKQVASRDVTGYFLVKNGEFAYNKSYSNGYPWGAIKRLDKYDMGVLSTLYIVFRPTKINSQFLVSYYDTTRWYREVSKNAAEGARNHGLLNIAPTDFFNTLLVVPKIVDEQQKIGSFFKQLDDTIALHQRKLEKLQELKKGYLQKMFC
ncbi:restriction endonuclease subunit S [Lacticaseibacillus rhamnosus]|uniref:restriction endonuclease subunit S n=1 Tax=Lacticaseibacillus rhamnosus TaxID=47715 RepID=UPI00237F3A5F|nr:restriction endonuclease subunit S [Lacticaseibacillus rhamnosus]MDE3303321.1 restriction endonuclease subunit S [Lacticaseibacillus rhamnosus]